MIVNVILGILSLILLFRLYSKDEELKDAKRQLKRFEELYDEEDVLPVLEKEDLTESTAQNQQIDSQPTSSEISINNNLNLGKVTKAEAVNISNKYLKTEILNHRNTSFSSINAAAPVWWFDIPQEKFKADMYLILAKRKGFYLLKIPRNTFSDPKSHFYIRNDNDKVQLRISSEPGVYYMRDTAPDSRSVGFEKFIISEFK
ncbi:hypothetical protein NO995_00925 [Aestuariibaculum sp. M13]|uniref:hypothetical protein n=1 Tax=Aestuariibaculum sp. M13 TaxID=2967132 RepID=UPI002159FBF7|nr:hypothetical protein [Aestuariibaculum sp. M13]MCR8666234.1 hypothetical protein [Aestuariibaculum sp. M13]